QISDSDRAPIATSRLRRMSLSPGRMGGGGRGGGRSQECEGNLSTARPAGQVISACPCLAAPRAGPHTRGDSVCTIGNIVRLSKRLQYQLNNWWRGRSYLMARSYCCAASMSAATERFVRVASRNRFVSSTC